MKRQSRVPVSPPSVPASRATILLAGALILVAGMVAYHNSFSGALVLDDHDSIIDNASIRQLWPPTAVLSPPKDAGVGGRPLTNLTFALNYAVSGLNVGSYHAGNLALHLLAGVTLFGLVRRTLLQPRLRERFGVWSLPLALSVAALWTTHPLQTQAVNYVSQRTETLMGLCYLATLYCFIRGAQVGAPRRWLIGSVLAALGGVLSKEVIVTVPVIAFLYDRTFVAGSFREAWRQRRTYYLALAATTWLTLGFLLQGAGGRGVGFGQGVDVFEYALTSCKVVVLYLRLALWPHPLVFDYGNDLARTAAEVAPYALVLGLLLTGTLAALRWRPALGFVGAWFLVILAPTTSVVPVLAQPMAESRMYLPLAGIIALAVLGLFRIAGRRSLFLWPALAVGAIALTLQRNPVYRSEETLWRDTIAQRPNNFLAHNSLGATLTGRGQVTEAIKHFQTALTLAPDYPVAHYNLGTAWLNQDRLPDAIRHLEHAAQFAPNHKKAHYNLALALMEARRFPDAIRHFQEALRLNPASAEVHGSLGRALFQSGRRPEGIHHLEKAVRFKPDSPEAHNNLGAARQASGDIAQAIAHYQEALRLWPEYADARRNLDRVRRIQTK